MGYGHRYFRVRAPIRWFQAVGTSPSHTYIGRSRAIDTVHRAGLMEAGDTVHAIGATYLVRADGRVELGRLTLPKPLIEKSYGAPVTDGDRLEQMARQGLCEEIPQPDERPDYNAARVAADGGRYPDCTGTLLNEPVPASPVLRHLIDSAIAAGLDAAITRRAGSLAAIDVGLGSDPTSLNVSLRIRAGTAALDLIRSAAWPTTLVHCIEDGRILDDLTGRAGKTFTRRATQWAGVEPSDLPEFLRALADEIGAPESAAA